MARNSSYLLNLDIDKLFEDHKVDEVIEIEKALDSEIERKRVDLRSMVGDRYKDVLTASDAIKSMKTISESIVNNIQNITDHCENLISKDTTLPRRKVSVTSNQKLYEERTLVMQINLSLTLNEQIWLALDTGDNLKAAQFYLLAQHIHTGLSLTRKEVLERTPIIKRIKLNLSTLKEAILSRIKTKLESGEITAEETSNNLNALMLIKNHNTKELISIFINHRKTALNTVINDNHSSVRLQISAMVKCLITTIHLLHDCFMDVDDTNKGLIWQQLEKITSKNSPTILSQVELPVTHLIDYIPDIIKHFRPKVKTEETPKDNKSIIEDWLKSTHKVINEGLKNSLELVTNVKGLHIIREEALKIEPPETWDKICSEINLPDNFSVWYYFFQSLITSRARQLIVTRLKTNLEDIKSETAASISSSLKSSISESDLKWYIWKEEESDVSRTENKCKGLSMKTKGYSPNIVVLCENIDKKYLEILTDVSLYLYGVEFSQVNGNNRELNTQDFKFKRKFIDREELENHLASECSNISSQLPSFVSEYVKKESNVESFLIKSIVCARFLEALSNLCPHFSKCCTFNGKRDLWNTICSKFSETTLELWSHWVKQCVTQTKQLTSQHLQDVTYASMIKMLVKWDCIEIQEETEETTHVSKIKIPLKPSLALNDILKSLNESISCVLPHTLPKQIHVSFIEQNVEVILEGYKCLSDKEINQNQALQFLFDVKFVTMFCIPRDNTALIAESQTICDKFRSKIDPFDLDVFYSYLQSNVRKAVLQSQIILGCLLPSSSQLASLGIEKLKEQDKEPSVVALSTPANASWFPLLPITVPSQKTMNPMPAHVENKPPQQQKTTKTPSKRSLDATNVMKSSAASLFGGFTSDWFS